MESLEISEKEEMVVTQVSFGGFSERVSAEEVANFLEYEAGTIYRCRLKTSWTPPDSYPDFNVLHNKSEAEEEEEEEGKAIILRKKESYMKVVPHAFVHFAVPDAAKRAIDAAGRCELILNGRPLKANSGMGSSVRVMRRRTTDPFKFPNACVEIGVWIDHRDEWWASWKGPASGVDFVIDPFDDCCKIHFSDDIAFSFKGTKDIEVIRCDFKVEFLVGDIDEIKMYANRAPFQLLLQLTTAPWIYYRTAGDDIHSSVPFALLDDEDPWIRTTDFTPSGALGRCSSYKISLSPRYGAKLEKALAYMRERRIAEHRPKSSLVVRDEPEPEPEPDIGLNMSDPFFCIQHKQGLSFATMFLVNALIHKDIVSQHHLSEDFYALLRGSQSEVINNAALRHLYSCRHPRFDPCSRLKLVQDWLQKNSGMLVEGSALPEDAAAVRRLVITPTKAYCLPPEMELSNRVLRKYKEVSDRFLRVSFADEGMQPLNSNVLTYYVAPIVRDITANSFPQKTTVFRRVKSIMTDGFYLCGRKYTFLAFSPNQLRDRSAWFLAEDENVTVISVRSWMGRFSSRNVAKCAARMGQCFSSTHATVSVPPDRVDSSLPDIERNGYVFSDGIGKLTPELAMQVAEKLQLKENPPCAYQIRYAGCKGVIAVWPGDADDGIQLFLRPSMNKFDSDHTILEVASWTRFQPGFLNRQIVTLLSSLGVPDSVFLRMQDSMISKLDQMLMDTDVAIEILTASCSEAGNTAASMLRAGFQPKTEPHLKGMLSCIRFAQLKDLLARTRIFVPLGRWLMGCLDELGILEHGQCFIKVSNPSVEGGCFLRHRSLVRSQHPGFKTAKERHSIITGTVVVAKNPCLHPGDVRILEAVDVPGLHHLVDCLVFPQKGDRPHTNEASGSDLDGDLYFVTWDENLIPPGRKSWPPMDYTSGETKQLPRHVTHLDIVDFFMKNMVNENLGVICNAHVVHADLSEYGALDEKCLQLAELAATAVDFPKTGKLVAMPPSLRPKIYPDFMGKDDAQCYKSQKILGKLYRMIKDASDQETSLETRCVSDDDMHYDTELEIPGAADFLSAAWHNKCLYDGQLNALLEQYRVRSEVEVITGHVWSLPKYSSRKQGELKERLKNAFSALHREFRRVFETLQGSDLQLSGDEKSVLLEQKASAWYQVTYNPLWLNKSRELKGPYGNTVPTRRSFAWIAVDHLIQIKMRCTQ